MWKHQELNLIGCHNEKCAKRIKKETSIFEYGGWFCSLECMQATVKLEKEQSLNDFSEELQAKNENVPEGSELKSVQKITPTPDKTSHQPLSFGLDLGLEVENETILAVKELEEKYQLKKTSLDNFYNFLNN